MFFLYAILFTIISLGNLSCIVDYSSIAAPKKAQRISDLDLAQLQERATNKNLSPEKQAIASRLLKFNQEKAAQENVSEVGVTVLMSNDGKMLGRLYKSKAINDEIGKNVFLPDDVKPFLNSIKNFLEQMKSKQRVTAPIRPHLFVGPPGTGKTVLCRALAKATGLDLFEPDKSMLNQESISQVEEKIKELSPVMVLLDEIDSNLANREEMTNVMSVKEVTSMLEFINRINFFNQGNENNPRDPNNAKRPIVIVGATNYADNLDSAAASRFNIIRIPNPYEDLRRDIIAKRFAKELGRSSERDIKLIKNRTLITKITENSINLSHRNLGQAFDNAFAEIRNTHLEWLEIKDGEKGKDFDLFVNYTASFNIFYKHLLNTRRSTKESIKTAASKYITDEIKGVDLKMLNILQPELQSVLQEKIQLLKNVGKSNQEFQTVRVLLHGPGGSGKTQYAKAFAKQLGWNFVEIAGSSFDGKNVGDGAKNVRDAFRAAKALSPCVLFIDEIDACAPDRDKLDSSNSHKADTVIALLKEIDEALKATADQPIAIFAATNRIDDLDKPLKTRFTQFKVLQPSPKITVQIFEYFFKTNNIAFGDDVKNVLKSSKYWYSRQDSKPSENIWKRLNLRDIFDRIFAELKQFSGQKLNADQFKNILSNFMIPNTDKVPPIDPDAKQDEAKQDNKNQITEPTVELETIQPRYKLQEKLEKQLKKNYKDTQRKNILERALIEILPYQIAFDAKKKVLPKAEDVTRYLDTEKESFAKMVCDEFNSLLSKQKRILNQEGHQEINRADRKSINLDRKALNQIEQVSKYDPSGGINEKNRKRIGSKEVLQTWLWHNATRQAAVKIGQNFLKQRK